MKKIGLLHYFLTLSILIAGAAAVFGIIASRAVKISINRTAEENLSDLASVLINLRPPDMFENPEAAHQFAQKSAAGLSCRITVIAPEGTVLGDSHREPAIMDNHADREEIREVLYGRDGYSIRYSDTIQERLFYAAKPVHSAEGLEGIIRVAVPYQPLRDSGRVMPRLHLLWVFGFALLLISSVYWFYIRVKKSTAKLKAGITEYAAGNLSYAIITGGPAEIESAGNVLTGMAGEIRRKLYDLTEERNEIESVLDAMQEPVVLIDSKHRILRINPATLRLVEPGRTRIMGKTVIDVFRNTALDVFVRHALNKGGEAEDEIVMYRNEEIILHVYAKALPQKGWFSPDDMELLLVFNDLTKIRQLERVRKDFVANVSHELKTPLTLIKGFVETLSESADVEPEQLKKFLKIIDKHTHRLIAIIDDLLSLSRLESGEEKVLNFSPEPLKPILAQASGNLRSVSRQRGIMVALRVDRSVKADVNRQLIEQAVVNLLDNSLKYSPESSTVLITAGEDEDCAWISVKDEGCGIPPAEQHRIFERFYRVDKARSRDMGGTGLGLSIVNHIIQLHGGSIGLESIPGKGSTFTLKIPKSRNNESRTVSKA